MTSQGSLLQSLPTQESRYNINDYKEGSDGVKMDMLDATDKYRHVKKSELASNVNGNVPGERFRLLRRMSEPGQPNILSPNIVKNRKPLKGPPLQASLVCSQTNRKFNTTRRLSMPTLFQNATKQLGQCNANLSACSADLGVAACTSAPMKTKPTDVYRWTRRMSEPFVSLTQDTATREARPSGTFLISQIGLVKPDLKSKKIITGRASLPNITWVQPQNTRKLTVGTTTTASTNNSVGKQEKNITTMTRKLERRLSEPCRKGGMLQNFKNNETKTGGIESVSRADLPLSNSESHRRPQLIRRLSEPAGVMKTKYKPELPAVRDASFEGVDIHKWLETSRPDTCQSFEDLWNTLDTQNGNVTSETCAEEVLDEEHRSISQLLPETRQAWIGDYKHQEGIPQTLEIDEDTQIKDIIGNFNEELGNEVRFFRHLSAVEHNTNENTVTDLNRSVTRRHTISADGNNVFQHAQDYIPKPCWCLRCQMMNAMFYNGDMRLNDWGNYPCFKR